MFSGYTITALSRHAKAFVTNTIRARFENGKFSNARIELESNRIAIVTEFSNRARVVIVVTDDSFDSRMEKIEHVVHSFLESSSNRIAIVTRVLESNRARIELES